MGEQIAARVAALAGAGENKLKGELGTRRSKRSKQGLRGSARRIPARLP
jgi:hypothetical protein